MLTHERSVGDTRSLFAVALQNDGVAVNLSGTPHLPVSFIMVDSNGQTVIAENFSHITITDATNGKVSYDFQTADVADPGIYYGFFRVYNSAQTEFDTFPNVDEGIQITLFAVNTNRETPDPSIDIIALANAPIRTRTVEGTVEERSVNELIKADQYAASKAASTSGQPWGIKVARTRPGGMVT